MQFETHGTVLEPAFEESVLQQHAIMSGQYRSMAAYPYGEYDPDEFPQRVYHSG